MPRRMSLASSVDTSRSAPVRKARAVGLKATSAAPMSRQACSTPISTLRLHSEYSDCTATIGCTAWARLSVAADTSDRPSARTLPCFTSSGHRADAVLDRHALVPAVQVVQVDDLGAQTLEAVLAVACDGLGAAVDDALDAVVEGHAGHAALAGQRDLAAMRLEHPADQRLVGAEAVERGGVEHRHAQLQRAMQQGFGRLRRRWRAVGMAQVHAAQADGRDGEGADAAVSGNAITAAG